MTDFHFWALGYHFASFSGPPPAVITWPLPFITCWFLYFTTLTIV